MSVKSQSTTGRKYSTPAMIIIYDHILELSNLGYAEKMLYSFFYGLHSRKKCIYTSNGYLANMMGCTERYIQILMKSLDDKKYIERKDSNGRSRTVRVLETPSQDHICAMHNDENDLDEQSGNDYEHMIVPTTNNCSPYMVVDNRKDSKTPKTHWVAGFPATKKASNLKPKDDFDAIEEIRREKDLARDDDWSYKTYEEWDADNVPLDTDSYEEYMETNMDRKEKSKLRNNEDAKPQVHIDVEDTIRAEPSVPPALKANIFSSKAYDHELEKAFKITSGLDGSIKSMCNGLLKACQEPPERLCDLANAFVKGMTHELVRKLPMVNMILTASQIHSDFVKKEL